MRFHHGFLPLAIVAALAAAGMGSAAGAGAGAGGNNPLAETSWQLVALKGEPVAEDVKTTLIIGSDGNFGGRGGCNGYGGSISFPGGNAVALGDIFSTMMYCGEIEMAQERGYFDALEATTAYAHDGDTLVFEDAEGNPVATLVASAADTADAPQGGTDQPDLTGTQWRATSLAGSPVAQGIDTTLIFRPDGSVNGHSGCNGYGGGVSASADGTIAFVEIVTTQIGCMGPAGDQERALYEAFEAGTSYRADAQSLALSDADGNILAEFSAVSE